MRLVCPNCDAEYEVDAAAIPRDGRDVQCSNCGHAWYQNHPETEAAQEAEEDLYEPPVSAALSSRTVTPPPEPAVAPEPAVPPKPEPQPEPVPPVPAAPAEDEDDEGDAPAVAKDVAPPVTHPTQTRSLDETVLAVLREEAERETAARQAEAARKPVLEAQTEMPLADTTGLAATVKRIARLRAGQAEPEPTPPPAPQPAKSRGEMFPAIEEINSTLRATTERSEAEDGPFVEDAEPPEVRKRGSRRGFVMIVLLAVLIVALYVLAPVIAAKYPPAAGIAQQYVATVDAARVWLDVKLKALIETLRGMGGDGN